VPREDGRTGDLVAAAVQGVDALEAYFAGYLPQLVLAGTIPLAALAWIAHDDAIVAAILAVTIPLLVLFMILIGKGAQARARARWQTLARLSGHFLDVVRGLPTLRAHRREHAQAETIGAVSEQYRHETMGTLRVAFLSALVLELCAMVGTALAAATIGLQLDQGTLTLEVGLTALLLAPELYAPLRAVGQQFHASADGQAAAERIFALLDEPLALTPPATHTRPAPDPAREPVRLRHVSFAYPGRDRPVLDALDLELEPGAVTALTGPSGAGKSTIAALLLRLIDPDAGAVTCGGVDLRDLDADTWRGRLAWLPQRTRLFTGTIAQNIALADPAAARDRVQRAASAASLDELLAELPDGLDTQVGEGGRTLSAGQAQRIGLARVFLRDASLVVLDEPTAHLDAATCAAIAAAIRRLAHDRTILLIAHSRALMAHADHVIVLAEPAAEPLLLEAA
jgi:thiol reductant ABC exporter CydD subunit